MIYDGGNFMTWYEVYLNEIKEKKGAELYIKDKLKHKEIFINK